MLSCRAPILPSENIYLRFSEVFYVDASSKATIDIDLTGIALQKRLGEKAEDILHWLVRTPDRWLLVLDNADDPALDLMPFIPRCMHGNIIITTRNEQLSFYERSYRVSRMSEADAKALFVHRSCIANPTDVKINRLITELVEVRAFFPLDSRMRCLTCIQELDFLALGIVQAAAYLQINTTCTLQMYLTLLRSDRRRTLEEAQAIDKPDDYKQTVYSTWNIILEQLRNTHPEAVTFLFVCSFMHHRNISEYMFANAAINAQTYMPEQSTHPDSTVSWVRNFLHQFAKPEPSSAFDEITASICSYSLVEVSPEHNLSVHCLVHEWNRHLALIDEQHPGHTALILYLSVSHFSDLDAPDTLAFTRMLLPHMEELETLLDSRLDHDIASRFERIYFTHGWWRHSEILGTWAMEARRRVLGDVHPSTLVTMANLASTYHEQGRWTEAERLGVTVLETSKRVLGLEHPDTLTRMVNLGSTYLDQGRRTEAERLQVTAMEARRRVLGEDHSDTLRSMANLAGTYENQGRWAEAEKLAVTATETSRRVLGEDHPDTLNCIVILALVYSNQGRWSEAEGMEVTVVETMKRVLGEEHPHTLKSMANLAGTYKNQGRWAEAEKLGVMLLETRKRVLGEEHPDTLNSMAKLASVYSKQGRWIEAEQLEQAVVELRKRVLGEEHPDTLSSISKLRQLTGLKADG